MGVLFPRLASAAAVLPWKFVLLVPAMMWVASVFVLLSPCFFLLVVTLCPLLPVVVRPQAADVLKGGNSGNLVAKQFKFLQTVWGKTT